MGFTLKVAFSEDVAGVFTLASPLDGPDLISDIGAFAGTFDDVTDDVRDTITVQAGTDQLAGSVQASSLTATVSRVDDPGYWNPNNPASPLNGFTPGFDVMRPGQLEETTSAGATYSTFFGFLRRATWRASQRSCELYFEDLLFRASRVYPVVASTGPTTTGAAVGLVLDAMGWTWPEFRSLATGDTLDSFSADGTQTALQLFSDLIAAERGTVFVRGDGVFVYESRDMSRTRAAAWTLDLDTDVEELESGIDADSIGTRVTVTKTDPSGETDGTIWASVDTDAERVYGRSDIPAVSSPYIPADGGAYLAEDLVYDGVTGKPPVTVDVTAVGDTDPALTHILASPLKTVVDVSDPLGGTSGEFVIQRVVHTVGVGFHKAEYTATKRSQREFTLASQLDGPDLIRY